MSALTCTIDFDPFVDSQRSFLDNLLDGSDGQTSGQLYRRYSSADTVVDEGEGERKRGGGGEGEEEGVFEAVDCDALRVKRGAQRVRLDMVVCVYTCVSVSYTHLTLPTIYSV